MVQSPGQMLLCAEYWSVFFVQQEFGYYDVLIGKGSVAVQNPAHDHHRLILKFTIKKLLCHACSPQSGIRGLPYTRSEGGGLQDNYLIREYSTSLRAENRLVLFVQQAFCFGNILIRHNALFLHGSADGHHRLILKFAFKELLRHAQTTLEYLPDTQPT